MKLFKEKSYIDYIFNMYTTTLNTLTRLTTTTSGFGRAINYRLKRLFANSELIYS